MSRADPSGALRDVRALFGEGIAGGLSDRQLLERFVKRDAAAEAAFTTLLQRHGPMVWGVCLRVLSDRHAAADAFQATFLVLLRRAPAIRVDDSLGRWLYGVSRRVAARARATARRRATRESGDAETVAAPAPDPDAAERLAVLDEEIGRLPAHYRAAVVLCDLERLPHEEAARRLGCPVGTVESRLSRGRRRLRDRLVRRGLAPVAAAVWSETAHAGTATMPPALVAQTARFALDSPLAGAVPAAVGALAEGVIAMMKLAKLKPLAAVAAALLVTMAAVGVLGQQSAAPGAAGPEVKGAPPPAAVPGPGVPANRALARDQLALIDKALADLHRLVQAGEVRVSDPAFSLWGRRRLDALRTAGATKEETVAALQSYLDTLKKEEAIAQRMYQQGQATRIDWYDVQFRRMEAEIWLNQEKGR